MSEGKVLVVLPTLGDRLTYLEETLRTIDAERAEWTSLLPWCCPQAQSRPGPSRRRIRRSSSRTRAAASPRRSTPGIRAATTEEYYAWIGDDDLFRPGALTQLRDLLEANPDAVVSYGGCDYIDPEGRLIGTSRAGRAAQWLLPWGPDLIPHPGSMIRLGRCAMSGCLTPR